MRHLHSKVARYVGCNAVQCSAYYGGVPARLYSPRSRIFGRFPSARYRHTLLRFRFTRKRASCDGRGRGSARYDYPYYTRIPILRFFNPWVDVAHNMAKENRHLGAKVATYTETWGLVSVLLCGLSVTALVGMPSENKNGEDDSGSSRRSLLVSWGLLSSLEQQHDAYIGSFASAFFASASSLGVSTVLNVLASVTPNSHMRAFIIRHSWQLCAIPFVTAISGGFVGLALAIGIDLTNSPNVARIALGGFVLTTLLVSSAATYPWTGRIVPGLVDE